MRIRWLAYRNTIKLIRSSVLYGTMYRVASIYFCIFQRCTSHRTMYMTYYTTYTWILHDSVKAEYDTSFFPSQTRCFSRFYQQFNLQFNILTIWYIVVTQSQKIQQLHHSGYHSSVTVHADVPVCDAVSLNFRRIAVCPSSTWSSPSPFLFDWLTVECECLTVLWMDGKYTASCTEDSKSSTII